MDPGLFVPVRPLIALYMQEQHRAVAAHAQERAARRTLVRVARQRAAMLAAHWTRLRAPLLAFLTILSRLQENVLYTCYKQGKFIT